MDALVACEHCESQISDTALNCPICWKQTGNEESLAKKVSLAAGIDRPFLASPAGAAGGLVNALMGLAGNRRLRKLAAKMSAIDGFSLETGILMLVTETQFVIVIPGTIGSTTIPGFLRSDLHDVYIDESKSKAGGFLQRETTVLHLDYFDTNYRKKKVHDNYKFKGDDSRTMAEFALMKLKEYQVSQDDSP